MNPSSSPDIPNDRLMLYPPLLPLHFRLSLVSPRFESQNTDRRISSLGPSQPLPTALLYPGQNQFLLFSFLPSLSQLYPFHVVTVVFVSFTQTFLLYTCLSFYRAVPLPEKSCTFSLPSRAPLTVDVWSDMRTIGKQELASAKRSSCRSRLLWTVSHLVPC